VLTGWRIEGMGVFARGGASRGASAGSRRPE
jgi:hypothetical protein